MISRLRPSATILLLAICVCVTASSEGVAQQESTDPFQIALRDAGRLDVEGRLADARATFQHLIDSAPSPAARAAAQRGMAMSYAFAGDCANTVRYEEMVIAYLKTREQAEPQNAFYQQGEMANEAARVCIDAGDLATAEKYYRLGSELGTKEPQPATHSRALWDFRLSHALGRLAARRGDKAEAARHVEAARQSLAELDSATAAQQRRFFPYLVGYVALYTNDLGTAEKELSNALAIRGNERDPFMHVLMAMTYEKLGRPDKAKVHYQKGYELALAHNPPAAYARRIAGDKLGVTVSP